MKTTEKYFLRTFTNPDDFSFPVSRLFRILGYIDRSPIGVVYSLWHDGRVIEDSKSASDFRPGEHESTSFMDRSITAEEFERTLVLWML